MGRRGRRRAREAAGPVRPYIEPLPVVGTTWYERGPAYWWRRAGMSLALIVALACEVPLLVGFLSGIRDSSPTGFRVALVVVLVLGIATGVLTWVGSSPARALDRTRRADPGVARRAAFLGAGLGGLARGGSVIAGLVLVIGGFLFVGPLVALLLRSFGRYLWVERVARARLAASSSSGS
ncbi:MAG: hypothetical protein E6F99_12735 [Actinobacteria bacterium]|nr:MAG: hypothetical protein E6F99_12735 [Actinomycetota bacterium]